MSLYFTGLRLTNFLPFRGEHQVDLGPGVFALVAERDGDPRRSNAVGKSALLWAMRFVLTGDHPRRTEDEWLTDGEREGGVDAELSDGTFVSRWRTRGDATRLKVITDNVSASSDVEIPSTKLRELHGDLAQQWLDKLVGLSKTEQATTWWCEQGRADAFVNGDPGETTADVVRWCGVEPVRRSAKRVSEELAGLLKGEAKLLTIAEEARAEATRLANPIDYDVQVAQQAAHVERFRTLVEKDRSEAERARERRRLFDDAARYDAHEREVAMLEQVAPAPSVTVLAEMQASFDELRGQVQQASADERAAARLARGEFDGVCPVGGIACPAKDQLNADADTARNRLATSRRRLTIVNGSADAAAAALSAARNVERNAQSAAARLGAIRPEMARLKPAHAAAAALSAAELTAPVPMTTADLDAAVRQLDTIKERRAALAAAVKRGADADAARAALAPDITARREALQLLGPSGAQRRLVDDFLGEVEDAANEDLASAGVSLLVRFEWQRELDQPADVCPNCGQPFPSSRKIKACEHCGAPRGRKVEQKLRCLVAPKSGGMDALAGVGVRLAALAWLKARRASNWSVACLDEPLSAVDAHNRMLVGRHLVAMLGGHYGIEQAFVSAHDPALLGALPRRIIVRGSEQGSTIEVLA